MNQPQVKSPVPFSSLTLGLAVLFLGASQSASAYTLTIIQPAYTGTGSYSGAFGISPGGKVTGASSTYIAPPFVGPGPNIKKLAFLWSPTNSNGNTQLSFINTGTLSMGWPASGFAAWQDHSASIGLSVNDSGEVAGVAGTDAGGANQRGFCWDGTSSQPGPSGPLKRGYILSNQQSGSAYAEPLRSYAYGISSSGLVVGSSEFYAPNASYTGTIGSVVGPQGFIAPFGFLADSYRIGFPLTASSSQAISEATGINNFDDVVGWSKYDSFPFAFLKKGSTYYDIGRPSPTVFANPSKINSYGDVILTSSNGNHLWRPLTQRGTSGTFSLLPSGAPGYVIGARDVARSATGPVVVGTAAYGNPVTAKYAWIWVPGGTLQDLNSLYPTANFHFDSAEGINDVGQIVGSGTWTSGGQTYTRGYLITP